MPAVTAEALDQIFRHGRSLQRFLPRPVEAETLHTLYELVKLGPTGFNAQPARFLFLQTPEARTRLAPALSSANRERTLAAPVSVVVAWDSRFHDHLPQQFPAYDAKSFFEARPELIEPAARTSATLQTGYLILAARALGLDAGPMSGFSPEKIDAEFFPDSTWRTLLLVNLGYGDRTFLPDRGPRLRFNEATRIL